MTSSVGALMGICVLLVVALVAILLIGISARSEIDRLETASGDNIGWSLSQSDVELRRFEVSIVRAMLDPQSELSNLRNRYDILYSRISILRESAIYAALRDDMDAVDAFHEVSGWVDGLVPLIDGDDADLRAALPTLLDGSEEAGILLRRVSLATLRSFAENLTAQREALVARFDRLAILAAFVMIALVALATTLLVNTVSLRQRTETIAQASRFLGAIIGTANDAVVVADRTGRIADFNTAATRIFGYERDDIIGQRLEKTIIPTSMAQAHVDGMQRYRDTGQRKMIGAGPAAMTARRKSGEIFPAEVSLAAVRGPDGDVFVSFIRDISQRVEAEQALISARESALAGERAKANLIAVMSHEMRTPLNGLIGALDLIRDTDMSGKQAHYVDVMDSASRMLRDQVNDVLDISRYEAAGVDYDLAPVDMADVIDDVIVALSANAQARGNSIQFDLSAAEPGYVLADVGRLRQVFVNLIGNAIKFTRNGEVTIRPVARAPGFIDVEVADTGIGIRPEDQQRIFDDFVTIDTSYQRDVEGTGLGLGITRRIVEGMGGQIGVTSAAGEGAVFWIRLITAQDMAVPDIPASLAPSDPSTRSLSVLLVEDQEINRTIVGELIETLGHSVTLASSGQAAVDLAKARAFDVVLMDISMPGISGVEATRLIRQTALAPDTPIIALTAHALPAEVASFRQAGMDDILNKPVTRDMLNAKLQGLSGGMSTGPMDLQTTGWLNTAVLEDQRAALGAERQHSLITSFLDEAAPVVAAIGQITAPVQDVHRISGSAALVGASALHAALTQLENQLKSGAATTDIEKLSADVVDAFAHSRAALMRYCGDISPAT